MNNTVLRIENGMSSFELLRAKVASSATFQIMRRGESAIVSDPKSELFRYCSDGIGELTGSSYGHLKEKQ